MGQMQVIRLKSMDALHGGECDSSSRALTDKPPCMPHITTSCAQSMLGQLLHC